MQIMRQPLCSGSRQPTFLLRALPSYRPRHREDGTERHTAPKRGRVDSETGCNAKFVFVRPEARFSEVEIAALGGLVVTMREACAP